LTIINTSHIVVKTAAKLHDVKADVKISLIPIMVGGSYNKNISEKFSLNGKLFCGVGLINFESNCSFCYFVLHETQKKWHRHNMVQMYSEIDENSCCFIADFSVGPQYSFTKRFSIGLDLGYRFTPTTTMPKDIKLDFSGFTSTLSLSYKL
jgi:hypothetical protein